MIFFMKASYDRQHERGSVLIMIFIGVALFGALSFTVAQIMRSGNPEMMAEQQASILADEIMNTGRQYRAAIQDMRISNGCADEDISFEAAALAGYVNGTNTDCQVFHSDGGGLIYAAPISDFGDGSDWIFTGSNIVDGVGSTAPDLIAVMPNIKLVVCNQINDKLSGPSVGTDADIDFTEFTGTYASTQTLDFAAGNLSGCLNHVNSGDNYFYYQVLIAR